MSMWRALRAKTAAALGIILLASTMGGGNALQGASAASLEPGPQDPEEVGRFLDEFFAQPEIKNNMAGAVVIVAKGDELLAKKGYGYADIERKLPVDPDRTVFRIASISKVVTATAVMQLAEQGKIDLNAELSAYLGGVRIPNKTDVPLTMRHLLMNSTGFEHGDTSELMTQDLQREIPLRTFVQEHVPTVIREPGRYYRYDNLGFTIQGYAVEQVSGEPFDTYVRDHIFKPLGMTSSDFRLTPQLTERLAVPYNVEGEPIAAYTTVPTVLPSGGMLSTGSDMARFMMAHLNGGKLGDARIMQEATAAEMHKPQLAIHAKLSNMAYGFEYANQQIYNGRNVVEKGGDIDGYHSDMWLLPDEKVGVYVNVNKDFDFRGPLFEAFMDHYYPEKGASETPLAPSQQSLAKFEGVYGDLRNRMWTTRIHAEDGLLIATDPLGKHTLREIEPMLFRDENGVKAAFTLNDDGTVQAFYYDQKSDSWSLRLPEPRQYSDIDSDDPYASYIYHLRQLEVIGQEGGETPFQPDQTISRGELVGWFIRWTGLPSSEQTPVFTDIADSPYKKEIQAAYEFGIIKGSGGGKFKPLEPISREAAAMIVWNMASAYLYASPLKENLGGTTDPWATEGVQFVVAKGLYGPEIAKASDGTVDYRSKEPMLRKEAAALLSTFADNLY
ncbi:serine hydrolase [Paenibacillus massiliensis]|uniref:serine hydrolase n=1 Tax=Paenibacillus massiliensis TaxID=225917 RepID=UPI00041AF0D2|nr:serine hydrolase [Paenibacillus massiliensis]